MGSESAAWRDDKSTSGSWRGSEPPHLGSQSAAKPLCGANWPTPCEDCVGSCGIEEYEAESAAQTSDGWTGTLYPSLRCDYCGVEVVGSDAPSLDSAKEAHRENCPEHPAASPRSDIPPDPPNPEGKPPKPSAASPSPLDVLRSYVERAADWGDAGIGRSEAMEADLAEGEQALTALTDLMPSEQFLIDVRAVVAYHWSGLPERRPDEVVWARLDAVLFDDEGQEREQPDYEARP